MEVNYLEETRGKSPFKHNLANRVAEKLLKTGLWQNINLEWSHSLQAYIITGVQILFCSEQYLKLSTFIPLSDLDNIHTSFFENLEQDSKAIQPYLSSRINHQYVLAIVSNDDELILQSINFNLKKVE